MVIQTQSELQTFLDKISSASVLFVDTEFVGEGRYYPAVGAIQIAGDGELALIDPLAIEDLAPLKNILLDPGIEKVFHAARQDLAIFYCLFGEPVTPVFDTQIAAALLGNEEQISFARLVERVTGTLLRKSHSFTDWLRRPLSPKQVEYALEDVRYLAPVYECLQAELQTRGRRDWAREEFHQLEECARLNAVEPRELFRQLRGADRLKGEELARLQNLAAWREETAQAQNLPVGRICLDGVLMELARHPRADLGELREVRGLHGQQAERFGRGLLQVLQQPLVEPYPTLTRPPALPSRLEPTVDFLTLCLRSLAAENEISSGLLATRYDLTQIALSGEKAKVPLLRGWRRQAVGEEILQALQGKVTVHLRPKTRQVELDWQAPDSPG
jgi:ribonuclease D